MSLITQQEVIAAAFLEREEISPSSIRPLRIDIAEEKYIRPRFGDALFEEFAEGNHSNFVNEYIKPALAHYVRSGVIDELSMQVGDNGVITFGSSNNTEKSTLTHESLDRTTTNTSTDTVTQSEATVGKKTVAEDYGSLIVDDNNTGPSPITPTHTESVSATDETGDRSSEENDTTTVTTNSSNSVSNNEVLDEDASGSDESTQKSQLLRGADYLERRILVSRALNDAIVLVGRAVRYVEQRPHEFPSYEPKELSKRRFF